MKLKVHLLLFYPSTWYICDSFLFHIEIEGNCGWIIGGGGAKGMLPPPLSNYWGACPPPPPSPLPTAMFQGIRSSCFYPPPPVPSSYGYVSGHTIFLLLNIKVGILVEFEHSFKMEWTKKHSTLPLLLIY